MRNFLIITLSLLSFGTSQDKVSTENFTQYGDSYTGDLKDGKRDGEGIFIYPNGDRYEGEWKNDKRNGKGTYIYTFGKKYVGDWKDDKKQADTLLSKWGLDADTIGGFAEGL